MITNKLGMRAVLAAVSALLISAGLHAQEIKFLVGTYTENTSAEGVYMYSFNSETADAEFLSMAPSGNPSFVTVTPDGKHAYAVNEYNDGREAVSSFTLKGDRIMPLNSVPVMSDDVPGQDPCNILFTGRTVVTSNYTGGSVTAFPVERNGIVCGMSQSYSTGTPSRPAHMHCAVESPDGKYIFVTNLGMDCIHRFVKEDGINPLGDYDIAWKDHGLVKYGPRHMVFSADGRFAYLLCELADKLVVFSYSDGNLNIIQTLVAYPGKGHGSADIHLSPDGRFLYTSHRLKDDGIAIFYVDQASGKLESAGYQSTGKHPRNFAISPDGRYLLCACRDDNVIEVYSINKVSGALTPTGKNIHLGAPVCVQFIP